MKDLVQSNPMDSKADSHRFKNWKHKGRDAEVSLFYFPANIDAVINSANNYLSVCHFLIL